MKDMFIYPTKKNMIITFLLFQILIAALFFYKGIDWLNLLLWQMIAIGAVCIWRPKPQEFMDEREKNIILKWNSRILDFSSSCILIPIVFCSIYPETSGWDVIRIYGIPAFLVFVVFSVIMKKEFGGFFFYPDDKV